VLLLHAILPIDAPRPPATGLRGWPLREVRAAGLSAWATQCVQEGFSPGRDDLLAHHGLIEQALGACLPVRFPTWLPDEHAVRELLDRRRAELEAALVRVRGRVELAVTITWTGEPSVPEPASFAATPGRRFLEERRWRYATTDQRRAEAQRLAKLLEHYPEVLKARHTLCPSPAIAVSSALLVEAEHAAGVRKRLQAFEEGIRILVNGPWPPYSFVSLEG
jgi:Gas vesicle synthesis protein GvpL/GvpF